MELRHLRYFVAVAEELNFRRAAARLHLAQPALSAQIKALEKELEVRLLNRTTHTASLTAAGRIFLEEARAVLAAAQQAEARARNAKLGVVGSLRVGVIFPRSQVFLPEYLRSFRQNYPGIELSIFDLTSPEQLQRLRRNELDAAFVRAPVDTPGFETKVVDESHQVLALPDNHRLAEKKTLKWKDLDGEELVMLEPSQQHGYYDEFLRACARAGVQFGRVQYANDVSSCIWLISAGFGIAPTTASFAQVKRPGLEFRPLPNATRVHTLLVWRKDDDSQLLKNFIESFPETNQSVSD